MFRIRKPYELERLIIKVKYEGWMDGWMMKMDGRMKGGRERGMYGCNCVIEAPSPLFTGMYFVHYVSMLLSRFAICLQLLAAGFCCCCFFNGIIFCCFCWCSGLHHGPNGTLIILDKWLSLQSLF